MTQAAGWKSNDFRTNAKRSAEPAARSGACERDPGACAGNFRYEGNVHAALPWQSNVRKRSPNVHEQYDNHMTTLSVIILCCQSQSNLPVTCKVICFPRKNLLHPSLLSCCTRNSSIYKRLIPFLFRGKLHNSVIKLHNSGVLPTYFRLFCK